MKDNIKRNLTIILIVTMMFPFIPYIGYSHDILMPKNTYEINTSQENNELLNRIRHLIPQEIPLRNVANKPLNARLWIDKGIAVYGGLNPAPLNPRNVDFKPATRRDGQEFPNEGYFIHNGQRGEFRFLGFQYNDSKYHNISFPRDSDSGRAVSQKVWFYRPWIDRPGRAARVRISDFNREAIHGDVYHQEWIGRAFPTSDLRSAERPNIPGYTPRVHDYLHIQSPSTILHPGEGIMWQENAGTIWYQIFSIPRLVDKHHLPVKADIKILNREDIILHTHLDELTLRVEVSATLEDEGYFNTLLLATKYYTRLDLMDWEIGLLHSANPTEDIKVVPKYNANRGKAVFEVTITREQLELNPNLQFTGRARPIFYNSKKGNQGNANTNLTVTVNTNLICDFNVTQFIILKQGTNLTPNRISYSDESVGRITRYDFEITNIDDPSNKFSRFYFVADSVNNDDVQQRIFNFLNSQTANKPVGIYTFEISQRITGRDGKFDYCIKTIKVEIYEPHITSVPLMDMNVDMPEIWFDIVPYPVTESSSGHSSRTVTIDGVPVDADLFFSGNFTFGESDIDRLVNIEINYDIQRPMHIYIEPKFSMSRWVYVYSTKPRAEFRVGGTNKQNRKMTVTDNSSNVNPEFVLEHFPINDLQWRFKSNGGNIDSLRMRDISQFYKEFLFKEPGAYTIEVIATNTLGRISDPYTVDIWIHEDFKPAVIFNIWNSTLLRNEELDVYFDAVSTDDDMISKNIIELYYDHDNNGEATQYIGTFTPLEFATFTPTNLGRYMARSIVEESFGQETLPEFITAEDIRRTIVERSFFVDNLIPMTELYIDLPIVMPEIDAFIMLDRNLPRNKVSSVTSERVNFINYLRLNNVRGMVQNWDMHTYVFSQPASTTRWTGSSYPPPTTTFTSNGYSGTLNLISVSNFPYTVDQGRWVTVTETTTRTFVEETILDYWSWPSGSGWWWFAEFRNGSDDPNDWTVKWVRQVTVTETTTREVWEHNWVTFDDFAGHYQGTIFRHVRQPYTNPFRATADKYIIYVSDGNISELHDLNMVLSTADAKLILIGNNSMRNQIAHEHFILNDRDINELIKEALDYIIGGNPYISRYYVIAGETNFQLNFYNHEDEGDPIIKEEFLYVQDQFFFDTPMGMESFAVEEFREIDWRTNVINRIDRTGKFTIYRRIQDRPTTDPNFQEFNYYSNVPMLEIYAHRRPIALAELDWDYDPVDGVYLTTWVDKSFDWDHIDSRADRGIVDRKIQYRRNGGEWIYRIPDRLLHGSYELIYWVRDPEGVWSHPFTKNFVLSPSPPIQLSARARPLLHDRFSMSSIPASEVLQLYDVWTRFPFNHRLEVAMFQGSTQRTTTQVINYSTATGNKIGNDIYWNNINHVIPDTLPDGNYTLRITAVGDGGQTAALNFPVTVSTPINLVPNLPEIMITTSTYPINAQTTKYANNVTVQLYRNQPFTTTLSLIGTLSGDHRNWSRSYFVPANIPDGDYIARYTATTPNGNTQVIDLPFRVESLRVSASLMPNPAMAGDEIIFTILTEGYADRIEIFVDPDIIARDTRVEMGYSAQSYPITLNIDGSINVKTTTIKYVLWVTTEETLSKNGTRLRSPYTFTVRGWKGSIYRDVELTLDVQGNILELIRPGIKNRR